MNNHPIPFFIFCFSILLLPACAQQVNQNVLTELPPVITEASEYNELSAQERRVILNKGTEWAFSGAYHDAKDEGTYICRQCNQPLFRSADKFDSGTGWPSFDDIIASAVKEVPDADGRRTEIVCSNCDGHLGHVFKGEGFTAKQTRHCVNSVSLDFVPQFVSMPKKKLDTEVQPLSQYIEGKGYEAYEQATFAGGCFWCTEAAFELLEGVVDVISGYTGGKETYPTYKEVSAGLTGHTEGIAIFYDPEVISYETLLEVLFVAHDPTQLNRQGPDVGTQYRSGVFYHSQSQKEQTENAILQLDESGTYSNPVVTEITKYETFWVAEDYHQDYYPYHPENPYVQHVTRPKVEKVKKTFKKLLKKEKGMGAKM